MWSLYDLTTRRTKFVFCLTDIYASEGSRGAKDSRVKVAIEVDTIHDHEKCLLEENAWIFYSCDTRPVDY
ncbi:unnamed protein product [Calypogeia fissa]